MLTPRTGRRVGRSAQYLALYLLAALFVTPLLVLLIGAGKASTDLYGQGYGVLDPQGFAHLGENLRTVLGSGPGARSGGFLTSMANSLVVSALTVVLGLVVNSTFGYALAKLPMRGRRIALLAVVLLVIVPFEALAVPLLLMSTYRVGGVGGFALSDTLLAQVLPFVAQPLYIFMFYSFFRGIPNDLEEAAALDGAGTLRTFVSIVVPLALPAYASAAILSFLYSWGQFLWPVMVTAGGDGDKATLPLGLYDFVETQTPNWGAFYAYAAVMVLPVILMFLVFQRWFVQGVTTSGIKG